MLLSVRGFVSLLVMIVIPAGAAENLDAHRDALMKIMNQVPEAAPSEIVLPKEADTSVEAEIIEPSSQTEVSVSDVAPLPLDLDDVDIEVAEFPYSHYLNAKELKKFKKFSGKRIAIPVYRVGFTVQTKTSAQSMAALDRSYGGVTASMVVSLAGISNGTMQAITERAYRDFTDRLVAEGFDLVPMSEIEQTSGYQKIRFAKGLYSKNILGTAFAVFSPTGMPLFWDFGNPLGNAGFSIGTEYNEISRETDSLVVFPTLVINFVEMSSSGRSMIARDASVDAEMGISLTDMSMMQFRIGHPKVATAVEFLGTSRLKDPYFVSGDYGQMVRGSENYSDQALVGLVSQGMGTALSSRVQESRLVRADPGVFSNLALQALGSGNNMFARALADGRDGIKPPKKNRR